MSSPVASLFMALQGAMSRRNEAAVFIDEAQKRELLKGIFASYYHAIAPENVRPSCRPAIKLPPSNPEWVGCCGSPASTEGHRPAALPPATNPQTEAGGDVAPPPGLLESAYGTSFRWPLHRISVAIGS
jgi:hypothetical protein